MNDQPITIRVTKEVEHKDASPRWRVGTQIITTRKELADRGVPSDSYIVAPGTAPASGEQNTKTTAPTRPPQK
jgi:hypothetical protein